MKDYEFTFDSEYGVYFGMIQAPDEKTFLKEWQKVTQSVGYRSSMNNFTDKILAAFCKSVLCVWPSLSKGNDAVEVSAESLSFNGGIWSGGESAPADGENAESSLFKPFHIRELQ